MKSRSSRWVSGIGAVLVVGGLVLASYGTGVTPASAAKPVGQDPHAGLPQNWDQTLPAATRFVLLLDFANAAVRDNETVLVWEQNPAATTHTWGNATFTCIKKTVGGRKGWRLPAIAELTSLVDPTVASPGPTLPAGHPFTNVQSAFYWSATTLAVNPTNAWLVNFNSGIVSDGNKAAINPAWCVRGGMNADAY